MNSLIVHNEYYEVVMLYGGSRHGEPARVGNLQKILYMKKRITREEMLSLTVGKEVTWKWPEDVYEKDAAGNFCYSRTVNYKPQEKEMK